MALWHGFFDYIVGSVELFFEKSGLENALDEHPEGRDSYAPMAQKLGFGSPFYSAGGLFPGMGFLGVLLTAFLVSTMISVMDAYSRSWWTPILGMMDRDSC